MQKTQFANILQYTTYCYPRRFPEPRRCGVRDTEPRLRVFCGSFFWLGLDALGEYSLSGLCVADRKSRRLPLLYGFIRKLKFFSVFFVSFCSKSVPITAISSPL